MSGQQRVGATVRSGEVSDQDRCPYCGLPSIDCRRIEKWTSFAFLKGYRKLPPVGYGRGMATEGRLAMFHRKVAMTLKERRQQTLECLGARHGRQPPQVLRAPSRRGGAALRSSYRFYDGVPRDGLPFQEPA